MLYRSAIGLCMLLLRILPVWGSVITVHPSLAVKTIGEALRLAHNGDTILIKKAKYTVVDLIIDKPVTLIGENYPELNGLSKDEVLIVQADHVTIKGLYICNTNTGSMKNYAGIRCDKVADIKVENNRVENSLFPIYLPNCRGGLVKGNTITGKGSSIESGSGIYLWHSSDIVIDSNRVSGQRDGIYFEFSTGCTVSGNICEHNYRYGLHFMFSDNDAYYKNIFRDNGSGVAVMYSRNIIMAQNRFEHNWGAASYGLLLKEINDSRIYKNIFNGNTTGIFMESSNRSQFFYNEIRQNGWALRVMGDCTDNAFRSNNFIGNTFDVSTNSSSSQNIFDRNYWDKYEGYDLNRDKIGDIPYHPVSLYGVLLEQLPYAIVLLHSLTVTLMDKAERSIPSLTPAAVIDHHPRMQYAAL